MTALRPGSVLYNHYAPFQSYRHYTTDASPQTQSTIPTNYAGFEDIGGRAASFGRPLNESATGVELFTTANLP